MKLDKLVVHAVAIKLLSGYLVEVLAAS